MERFEAKVTSKGQITLPSRLRSALKVQSGDKVVFERDDKGTIKVHALSESLEDLRGIVRSGSSRIDGEMVSRWIDESRGARWRSK